MVVRYLLTYKYVIFHRTSSVNFSNFSKSVQVLINTAKIKSNEEQQKKTGICKYVRNT